MEVTATRLSGLHSASIDELVAAQQRAQNPRMPIANPYIAMLRETGQTSFCNIAHLATSNGVCRSSFEEVVFNLKEAGIVTVINEEVHVIPGQRLRIAELAIQNGADPERIARELRWQEFEAFASQILAKYEYKTARRLVFSDSGHRFEIDVLGAKEPILLCIDCKHWHHGWAPSKITMAAMNQLLRAFHLSKVLKKYAGKVHTLGWRSVQLLPALLTLADVSSSRINGVPIVSVLRFRDFVSEVNPWVDELRFIEARVRDGTPELSGLPATSSIPALL